MNVAVQADGEGYLDPLIRSVNTKGLNDIARETQDLIARAKENKLTAEDLQRGTFSLTNLSKFGLNNIQSIVSPPQACVLSIGAAERRVLVDEEVLAKKDKSLSPYKVGHVVNVTLSSDHRVVDGAVAAQYGQEFKKLVENPEFLLL